SRRYPRLVGDLVRRLTAGAAALRTRRGLVLVLGATLAAALTATLVAWAVAQAVGIAIDGPEAVLFASGVALALAIPAAPASIGTYEFVGVVILSSVGASPEQALAAMLLMRVVSTVPLSLLGLGATWLLHLRPTELIDQAAPLVGDTAREAGR
ncbi:MAG TPA: lysylphosphatidylglycerol synthase domain-containing protein, partial [Candidatus Eisenbacteria bacterium]|nr:lysylphosphatidylglycerol synthase domain-containing protein [Candidatus Eisenbacteria bacterium]